MKLFCPQCRLEQPREHTYCLRCGYELPRSLLSPEPVKQTRFFAGVKVGQGDPENAYMRVSCYLKEQVFETDEGSVTIPGHHVRFSVWAGDEARCVLSLPETEAAEMARFIIHELERLGDQTADTQPQPRV